MIEPVVESHNTSEKVVFDLGTEYVGISIEEKESAEQVISSILEETLQGQIIKDFSVEINKEKVIQTDLSKYAEFSLKLSNEFPFLYGAFAIIAAISLGIFAAVLRKIISDLRKKKPKDEVKFPVK